MSSWLQKLTDIFSIAQTEDMLKQALAELTPELGFDCYAYLNVQPIRSFAVSNYLLERQV